MTEPLETSIYNLPRQVAGQGSRARMNQALDLVDSTMGAIAARQQVLDLQAVRVKIHGPYTMTEGQTDVVTAEPYQMGARRLEVKRSGLEHTQDVHWIEVDPTTIRFLTPSRHGEIVNVTEFQLGADAGASPPLPSGVLYTVTEEPLGVINSTDGFDGNGTFTVTHAIADGTTPRVRVSGTIELTPGTAFTWTPGGTSIEILPGFKPIPGESLEVEYEWRYV